MSQKIVTPIPLQPEAAPAVDASRRFILNPNARVLPFDTSASETMYQVILGVRRAQINERTCELLRHLLSGKTASELFDDLAGTLEDAPDGASRVQAALDSLLKRGFVLELDAKGDPFPEAPDHMLGRGKRQHPLALHIKLLSREQILPISSLLKHFFRERIFQCLIAFIVLSHFIFFLNDQVLHKYGTHLVHLSSPGAWAIIVCCVYLSVLFHELGHCAACEYYGVKHGEIGAGLLFIYPVFYADVADCWSLPRLHRAVVDSAGIYLQLLVSGVAGLIWVLTGDSLLRIFIYSTILTAAFNMNPFLRMDGYWLLADLSGVPQLYKAGRDALRYIMDQVLKRNRGSIPPEIMSRPLWIILVVLLHGVGSTAFFVYFFAKIILQVVPRLFNALPENLSQIAHEITSYHFSGQLAHLLIVCFFLCAAAVGATRFCFRLCRAAWKSPVCRPIRGGVGHLMLSLKSAPRS